MKQELVEFYSKYIDPASPHRAKLSVHLIAEKSTEKNKGPSLLTPEQQKQTLIQNLTQFLVEAGVKAEAEVLSRYFKGVDILVPENIATAVASYLKEDWKLTDANIVPIMEKGASLLKELHPQLVGDSTNSEEGEHTLKDSIVIEDVIAWKAGLTLTKAARPVRPLVEYEETESKL